MGSFPKTQEGAGQLGLNAGRGVVFPRWAQAPWAARTEEPARVWKKLLDGTSLSPALSQPLPDVVVGDWGPLLLLIMSQGVRARGGIRDPWAGGPLQPCCFLSDVEAPRGEVSSSLPASRRFAWDSSQACPAGEGGTGSGVPSFGALEGASDPRAAGWGLEARVRAQGPDMRRGGWPLPTSQAGFSPNGCYGFARPPRPVRSL